MHFIKGSRAFQSLLSLSGLALVLCASPSAQGQSSSWSGKIPYGGSLEQNGEAISRTVEMRFELYQTAEGSISIWASALRQVEVYGGRFKVVLGEAPDAQIPDEAFSRNTLYVRVQVADVWLAKRQRIMAVPFAHRAALDAPIGSILAWHKNFASTPPLPDGWAECNGQTVSDVDSPYSGQNLPNLNGEARFLRGATSSGTLQNDQLQAHKHTDSGHSHLFTRPRWFSNETTSGDSMFYGQTGAADNHDSWTNTGQAQIGDPVTSSGGSVRYGSETRPSNMSVVWIMKIK